MQKCSANVSRTNIIFALMAIFSDFHSSHYFTFLPGSRKVLLPGQFDGIGSWITHMFSQGRASLFINCTTFVHISYITYMNVLSFDSIFCICFLQQFLPKVSSSSETSADLTFEARQPESVSICFLLFQNRLDSGWVCPEA